MNKVLKLIVAVVVMFVSSNMMAAPFDDNYTVGNTNSTLFSKDIDINMFGNNLQKRNIQVKKADYDYSQRAEQVRRASIVNGAEQVSKASSQVALQNNAWNGYTSTGVNMTTVQNVTFNRPMTVDAYNERISTSDAFDEDEFVATGNMQKVNGFYGGGKEPGAPLTDVVWGFLLCALGYVVVRRYF